MAERDRLLADVSRIAARTHTPVLVIEHLWGPSYRAPRYARAILALRPTENGRIGAKELEQHAPVLVKSEETWKVIADVAANVCRFQRVEFPQSLHSYDSTIITFFNGQRWHVVSWHGVKSFQDSSDDPRLASMLRLIDLINKATHGSFLPEQFSVPPEVQ